MSLKYNINKVKNGRFPDGESHYSISLVRNSNISLTEIAEYMNTLSAFSPGDVTGMVSNLIGVIADQLASGNTVTLDGLGTFKVSAELKHPVTDPDKITGNDIQIKRVCFKPAPAFKNRIEQKASFLKYEPITKNRE
ncbi:MAG: HU family DNA-binding protein [Tannerellaceae bacterium]|nr:HU family DNA-binding protein [Tannerellaceae bacterium]